MIRVVRSRIGIGLFVMIRPRGGDFIYSDEELGAMREDIAQGKTEWRRWRGLRPAQAQRRGRRPNELVNLSKLARPLKVTFHRAFDMALDMETALEDIVRTGADRVLTSGGESTGVLGSGMIARMVERSAGPHRHNDLRRTLRGQRAAGRTRNRGHTVSRGAPGQQCLARPSIARQISRWASPEMDEFTRYTVLVEDVRALREAIDAVTQ